MGKKECEKSFVFRHSLIQAGKGQEKQTLKEGFKIFLPNICAPLQIRNNLSLFSKYLATEISRELGVLYTQAIKNEV